MIEENNKKYILLTGSNSGIGLELDKILSKIYNIIYLKSRLNDFESLTKELDNINKRYQIKAVINCAGFGIFKPLESISSDNISKLIDVNLKAPIIIIQKLLKNLKNNQAHIINISSIEALKHSKFSSVYTASKSGLRDFSLSLFEEVRKSKVKITSINPDITKTNFFNNLEFYPKDDNDMSIDPVELAKLISDIMQNDFVVTDITIRPKLFGLNKRK